MGISPTHLVNMYTVACNDGCGELASPNFQFYLPSYWGWWQNFYQLYQVYIYKITVQSILKRLLTVKQKHKRNTLKLNAEFLSAILCSKSNKRFIYFTAFCASLPWVKINVIFCIQIKNNLQYRNIFFHYY